jgi:fidgetin-like protein 1
VLLTLNLGTGKTELAKAVAGESGACFLLISPSSLLSKFIGESERLLSKVFAFAKVLGFRILGPGFRISDLV